jgi:hypothetical protein
LWAQTSSLSVNRLNAHRFVKGNIKHDLETALPFKYVFPTDTCQLYHREYVRCLVHLIFLFFNFSIFIYMSSLLYSYDSFIIIIIHLFICAYIVWVISPHFPPPLPSPCHPPCFQAEPVLPLSLILLKRRHKHNKEDKVFLLVELRVAIQRDS